MNKCLYPSKVTSGTESETGFVVTGARLDNDFRAFGAVIACRMVNVDTFSFIESNGGPYLRCIFVRRYWDTGRGYSTKTFELANISGAFTDKLQMFSIHQSEI